MIEEPTDFPEWATCDRTGCGNPATHWFPVQVCAEHLPDGAQDVQAVEELWWEKLSEDLQ